MTNRKVAIGDLEGVALRDALLISLGWIKLGPVGVTTEAKWSEGTPLCKMGHNDWWKSPAGDNWCAPCEGLPDPTANWSECGPLIERYEITISDCSCVGKWMAANVIWLPDHDDWQYGDTPLIAACRAIVAAHNPSGYVEVPSELVEGGDGAANAKD